MMFLQEFFVHSGFVIKPFKVRFAGKLDEVVIPNLIGREQNQMVILIMREVPRFLTSAAWGHIGFAADNGFDTVILGFLIEIDCPKQVAMVRHGHSRHSVLFHLLKERRELVGSIKEAILRVKVEVNEFGGHV